YLTITPTLFRSMPFFFYYYAAPRDLHSFPTRRSSDLSNMSAQMELKQDLGFVTEGLRARARFNTARISYFDLTRQYTPFFYQLRSEEHTSELQSRENLVCRLLLEKKKKNNMKTNIHQI